MRKVVGAVVAVIVVLMLAAVAWLQSGTASGQPPKAKTASGQPSKAKTASGQPPKVKFVANIKVPIAAKTYTLTAPSRPGA
jgi:hypothetical protein